MNRRDATRMAIKRFAHHGSVGVFLAAFLLSAMTDAYAQPAQVRRVAVLAPQAWQSKLFSEALGAHGYREGANLVLEVRAAEGRIDRLPAMAAEIVRSGPEVIVAFNTPGTRAAMTATRTIPIVMVEVGDPVATGFVSNLARPEGNVTGVSNLCGALGGKRFSLLKELVPAARRIAVMLNSGDPITGLQVRDIEQIAPSLGVEVRFFPAAAVAEVEVLFGQMLNWRPDAAMWLCGQQSAMDQRSIALAVKHRIPLMSYRREEVRSGGLISYASFAEEIYRRAASYVDKILKGAKPSDLPVEQPTQIVLTVNRKTAKAIGLVIPPSVLLRADQVIE